MSTVDPETGHEPAPQLELASWAFDGLLTNGEAVLVRPVVPLDASQLVRFHAHLSSNTIYRRFFDAHPALSPAEASHFAEVDYRDRMAFVVLVADDLVAFANYERLGPRSDAAEVAFVVADAYQQRGVATLLFESLAAYARRLGIVRFVADVLPENAAMLDVFAMTGLHCTRVNVEGTVRVELDLRPTSEYRDRCDAREATAEVASIGAVLCPRSIAVVGAGRRPGNVGHEVVRSLLSGDFSGTVYPVNPSARSICGVPAYPSLSSLPERIDLAVIAVPRDGVRAVLTEAAGARVRAATVITAGFGEVGPSGAAVELELFNVARKNGMRIVGPNCLGVVSTDPQIRMNATFANLNPLPGRLALVSQSGAVGIVLAEQARAAGLGLSNFVSVGNKLDVSSNDLLCFFECDERTSVIALYLESFGNPRKFARIARRVGQTKPIVALKSGRTPAGARGARSHTAAAATPTVVVSALLASVGVIQVDRLEELLDVSGLLLSAPLPKGRRVALVGNSGGPLILAADACEQSGLSVPELDGATRAALAEELVVAAALANPVDLTADGTSVSLEDALEIVLRDDTVDAAIVVVTDLLALPASEARAAVVRVAQRSKKPVVACVLGEERRTGVLEGQEIAEVSSPERAAAALAHVVHYSEWRDRPRSASAPSLEIADPVAIRDLVADELAIRPNGGWLRLDTGADLLRACGIPALATQGATSARAAAAAAQSMGFPVALKARAGDLVHKSDVGGVVLGLETPAAVETAYQEMERRLGPAMGGAVVQENVAGGVEAIVGLVADPVFGPVVMVGLGGVMTDLLGDRTFAVPPLDRAGAEEMVGSLRAAPLLDGYRGSAPVDRASLVTILQAVALLAEEVPELVELDLNPVLVGPNGALVVDCKARLSPLDAGPGPLFRALGSGPRR